MLSLKLGCGERQQETTMYVCSMKTRALLAWIPQGVAPQPAPSCTLDFFCACPWPAIQALLSSMEGGLLSSREGTSLDPVYTPGGPSGMHLLDRIEVLAGGS